MLMWALFLLGQYPVYGCPVQVRGHMKKNMRNQMSRHMMIRFLYHLITIIQPTIYGKIIKSESSCTAGIRVYFAIVEKGSSFCAAC
jgi:hypothetical protein